MPSWSAAATGTAALDAGARAAGEAGAEDTEPATPDSRFSATATVERRPAAGSLWGRTHAALVESLCADMAGAAAAAAADAVRAAATATAAPEGGEAPQAGAVATAALHRRLLHQMLPLVAEQFPASGWFGRSRDAAPSASEATTALQASRSVHATQSTLAALNYSICLDAALARDASKPAATVSLEPSPPALLAHNRKIRMLLLALLITLCRRMDTSRFQTVFLAPVLRNIPSATSSTWTMATITDMLCHAFVSLMDRLPDLDPRTPLAWPPRFDGRISTAGRQARPPTASAAGIDAGWSVALALRARECLRDFLVVLRNAAGTFDQPKNEAALGVAEAFMRRLLKLLGAVDRESNNIEQLKIVMTVYGDCVHLIPSTFHMRMPPRRVRVLSHPLLLLKHTLVPLARLASWHAGLRAHAAAMLRRMARAMRRHVNEHADASAYPISLVAEGDVLVQVCALADLVADVVAAAALQPPPPLSSSLNKPSAPGSACDAGGLVLLPASADALAEWAARCSSHRIVQVFLLPLVMQLAGSEANWGECQRMLLCLVGEGEFHTGKVRTATAIHGGQVSTSPQQQQQQQFKEPRASPWLRDCIIKWLVTLACHRTAAVPAGSVDSAAEHSAMLSKMPTAEAGLNARIFAARALGSMAPSSRSVVHCLASLFDDPAPRLRAHVAAAVSVAGLNVASTDPAHTACLHDMAGACRWADARCSTAGYRPRVPSPFGMLLAFLDDCVLAQPASALSERECEAVGMWALHATRHIMAACRIFARGPAGRRAAERFMVEISARRIRAAQGPAGEMHRHALAAAAAGALEGSWAPTTAAGAVPPLCDAAVLRAAAPVLWTLRHDASAAVRVVCVATVARVLGSGTDTSAALAWRDPAAAAAPLLALLYALVRGAARPPQDNPARFEPMDDADRDPALARLCRATLAHGARYHALALSLPADEADLDPPEDAAPPQPDPHQQETRPSPTAPVASIAPVKPHSTPATQPLTPISTPLGPQPAPDPAPPLASKAPSPPAADLPVAVAADPVSRIDDSTVRILDEEAAETAADRAFIESIYAGIEQRIGRASVSAHATHVSAPVPDVPAPSNPQRHSQPPQPPPQPLSAPQPQPQPQPPLQPSQTHRHHQQQHQQQPPQQPRVKPAPLLPLPDRLDQQHRTSTRPGRSATMQPQPRIPSASTSTREDPVLRRASTHGAHDLSLARAFLDDAFRSLELPSAVAAAALGTDRPDPASAFAASIGIGSTAPAVNKDGAAVLPPESNQVQTADNEDARSNELRRGRVDDEDEEADDDAGNRTSFTHALERVVTDHRVRLASIETDMRFERVVPARVFTAGTAVTGGIQMSTEASESHTGSGGGGATEPLSATSDGPDADARPLIDELRTAARHMTDVVGEMVAASVSATPAATPAAGTFAAQPAGAGTMDRGGSILDELDALMAGHRRLLDDGPAVQSPRGMGFDDLVGDLGLQAVRGILGDHGDAEAYDEELADSLKSSARRMSDRMSDLVAGMSPISPQMPSHTRLSALHDVDEVHAEADAAAPMLPQLAQQPLAPRPVQPLLRVPIPPPPLPPQARPSATSADVSTLARQPSGVRTRLPDVVAATASTAAGVDAAAATPRKSASARRDMTPRTSTPKPSPGARASTTRPSPNYESEAIADDSMVVEELQSADLVTEPPATPLGQREAARRGLDAFLEMRTLPMTAAAATPTALLPDPNAVSARRPAAPLLAAAPAARSSETARGVTRAASGGGSERGREASTTARTAQQPAAAVPAPVPAALPQRMPSPPAAGQAGDAANAHAAGDDAVLGAGAASFVIHSAEPLLTPMVGGRMQAAMELVLRHLVFDTVQKQTIDYMELHGDGLAYGSMRALAALPSKAAAPRGLGTMRRDGMPRSLSAPQDAADGLGAWSSSPSPSLVNTSSSSSGSPSGSSGSSSGSSDFVVREALHPVLKEVFRLDQSLFMVACDEAGVASADLGGAMAAAAGGGTGMRSKLAAW
ncbi:hypothetical protein HK105_204187 [Polyrhizophydium stewartii]|uniref:Uncharacterized protein n=1 Tax=Polyrhizophydium stewartii TaxID=2732419 RepID=A0ABR4N9G2_9FUNG